MKHYEILYLISSQYSEPEAESIAEKVKELITKAGGKITLKDNLGKKKLAYPIKQIYQGYYLLYEFDLEQKDLKKLNNDLGLTNEILRHLIVKKSAKIPSMVELTKEKVEEEKEEKKERKEKVKLEDLDKKLDELLKDNITY